MSLEIEKLFSVKPNARNNHEELPRNIRGIIVGKSGSGKTNLILNLLLKKGLLDYDNLIIYGRSLFQDEYKLLGLLNTFPKDVVYRIFQNQNNISVDDAVEFLEDKWGFKKEIDVTFFDNGINVSDPSEVDKSKKNLIIFDDVIGEKQRVCENYYTRGRHSNIDCFYISQNYFKLPRQTIRENSNILMLFKQDGKSMNNIYQDLGYNDFKSLADFKKICNDCWEEDYGFITIDTTRNILNGKYKNKLIKWINLEDQK